MKLAKLSSLSLLLLGLALAPLAWAQTKSDPPKGEDVVDRMMRSTCFLIVEHADKVRAGRMPYARGSGSLIVNNSRRKVVLTNYHVVGKYDDVCVMFPVRKPGGDLIAEPQFYIENRKNPQYALAGKVLDRWPEKDLAMIELKPLKWPDHLRALPLAEKSPRQASTVHTMGNPAQSGLWSYTKGEVRTVFEAERMFPLPDGTTLTVSSRMIDTNNLLSGGDSGGPLVNDRFEQVGVVQSVTASGGIASAIAVEEIWAFIKRNKMEREVQAGARTTISAPDEAARPKKSAPTMPELSAEEKKAQQERYAAAKLKQARQLSGAERKEFLEEIIEKYPGTKAAAEAKELLEKDKIMS
jgi:S1-C subfamily serine protease